MNIFEIDWRLRTIELILSALTEGLRDIEEQLETASQDESDWFSIDEALELSEGIYGIAFVAVQNYINGVVSDIDEIFGPEIGLKKRQLIKELNNNLLLYPVTQLEFCNAMANYFKHHEEWGDWEPTGHKKENILVLQKANIGRDTSYPCNTAASLLLLNDREDLVPLATILSTWRANTIGFLKEKYQDSTDL